MTSNGREHKWELFEIHFYVKCSLHIIQHFKWALCNQDQISIISWGFLLCTNINLHRDKCYSCFSLLYQMSWSLCVSLERGRVSEGTFQYKHHQWGREGPGQLHCTVSGPGGQSTGIRLLLHKAGRHQCKQLPGCSTWVSYPDEVQHYESRHQ